MLCRMARTTGIFPGWTGYFPREISGEFEGKILLAHSIRDSSRPASPARKTLTPALPRPAGERNPLSLTMSQWRQTCRVRVDSTPLSNGEEEPGKESDSCRSSSPSFLHRLRVGPEVGGERRRAQRSPHPVVPSSAPTSGPVQKSESARAVG